MPALLPWDETKESATTTSSKYWHYSHHHSFQFSVLLKPWVRRVVRSGEGKKRTSQASSCTARSEVMGDVVIFLLARPWLTSLCMHTHKHTHTKCARVSWMLQIITNLPCSIVSDGTRRSIYIFYADGDATERVCTSSYVRKAIAPAYRKRQASVGGWGYSKDELNWNRSRMVGASCLGERSGSITLLPHLSLVS